MASAKRPGGSGGGEKVGGADGSGLVEMMVPGDKERAN